MTLLNLTALPEWVNGNKDCCLLSPILLGSSVWTLTRSFSLPHKKKYNFCISLLSKYKVMHVCALIIHEQLSFPIILIPVVNIKNYECY